MPGRTLDSLLREARDAQAIMTQAVRDGRPAVQASAGRVCLRVLQQFVDYEETRPNVEPGYTRDRVSTAMNSTVNDIQLAVFPYESSRTIAAASLMDLVVNAALHRLDHPHATLAEVCEACYEMEEQDCADCGDRCFVASDEIAHHYDPGEPGNIDYEQDGDHVAVPSPATTEAMVMGWLEDIT